MLFADFGSWFVDGIFNLMILFGIACLLVKRWLKAHDKEGEIKGAAKKGALSLIGRWLK